jgi:D-lactate dehydrogenase
MKIAFFDTKPYDSEWFNRVNDFGYEFKYFETKLNCDTVPLAAGCDAACAFVNDTLDADVLAALDKMGIHMVAMRCAGYNNVDLQAAYGKVHITRVPDYSPYAVAEHAAALMLSCNRKIHKAYTRIRENNFSITGLMGMDLHGKTVGIIGTGKIGRVFIDICKGLQMHVLAYDAFPQKNSDIEYVTLKELYAQSDVISLHCPLNAETRHMIDREAISRMKKGVLIINTSRGALIDTEALVEGLKALHLGGAGLDVYEEESEYFFEDFSNKIMQDDLLSRLITLPNVIITSHQAFFTREAIEKIARITLQNIREYETGAVLANEICYACDHKNTPDCSKVAGGKNCF